MNPTDERAPTLLERGLILWLCLSSLLAFFWTTLLGASVPDIFVLSKPTISYQVALIMFAVGCLLPRDEIATVLKKWPTVLAGTALQYTVMPLLALSFALLFSVDRATFIGVMIVGCVPGAMASNVLTMIARGNVSYSVSLTTMATLLSPLVVPLTLSLALSHSGISLDVVATFKALVLTVVLPVITGHLLCRSSPRFAGWMKTLGPIIANVVILFLIAVVVGLNRDRLGGATAWLMLILLMINVLGYLTGYSGGALLGLPEGKRRALTIEIGMQNAGVGTALAVQLFKDQPEATIPTALYTFGCMLTGSMLAWWWSRSRSSTTDGERGP